MMTDDNIVTGNIQTTQIDSLNVNGKQFDPDLLNEDFEESEYVLNKAINLKPFLSKNALPSTLYLQQSVMPIIYEALNEVDKVRPKDPIEFFVAYILERNKN